MKCTVSITKLAFKQLEKTPLHITTKLEYWINAVETHGIGATRKIPGYHDEPLKGDRKGQRSIRLNKAYRTIYEETLTGDIHLISIIEVNKHDY